MCTVRSQLTPSERMDSLGEAALLALADCPGLSRLHALELNWQEMGPRVIEALGQSPHLSRLDTLHLAGNAIQRVAVEALGDQPWLPRLRDVAINEGPQNTSPDALRQRFGARLRLFHA